MSVRTEQDRARERARWMVELLTHDDYEQLAISTTGLIAEKGRERELLYPLLVEMTSACAQIVSRHSGGPAAADTAFVLDVVDIDATSERQVEIDQLPPSMRAVLRAILAWLGHHRHDALFQLSMATSDPQAQGRLDALVQSLLFLRSLLDMSGSDTYAPRWLRPPPT